MSDPRINRGMVESIAAIPRRHGAWLALLALALHLGLSIGHVHEIGRGSWRATALTRAKPVLVPASDRSPARVPAIPAEDQCPICFGLAVSGTFIPATAIPVILALVPEAVKLDAVAQIIDLPRTPFYPAQPRAPPPAALLA